MELKKYLKLMVEMKASDMFYRSGTTVRMRINGKVVSITDEFVSVENVNETLQELLSEELTQFFRKNLDADFALYVPELDHRFRVSIFMQRNWPAIVIRRIPLISQTFEELNLPVDVLKNLCSETRGLVLLTGATGSGKSTTIASMIEYINSNHYKHVLTLEEPIEFTFKDRKSLVNQREIGKDVASYPVALRAFTLQSPDVIYIGNIRDYETMSAALTTSETGVLLLSTLHTINASQTIERIINLFPPHQHQQVRTQLSSLLKGVISLRLVPLKDGTGRVPAYEVMLLTPTISRLIREGKIWEIPTFIEDGGVYGMQSFDQALLKLVKDGKVEMEEAMSYVDRRDEFLLSLKGIKK